MTHYVTISISKEVKDFLEKLKRPNEDWSTFLFRLANEYLELKRKEAFNKLSQLLTDEDLRNIEESMKEFRRNFKLGVS